MVKVPAILGNQWFLNINYQNFFKPLGNLRQWDLPAKQVDRLSKLNVIASSSDLSVQAQINFCSCSCRGIRCFYLPHCDVSSSYTHLEIEDNVSYNVIQGTGVQKDFCGQNKEQALIIMLFFFLQIPYC